MKIFCYSDGDSSVGIPGWVITIEVHNIKESSFDPDELGYILDAARNFAGETFDDNFYVTTEEEEKRVVRKEKRMYEEMIIDEIERDLENKWFSPIMGVIK